MSELSLFLWTLAVGGIALFAAEPLADALLRVGLWLNGIDAFERDRTMEFRRTGKLPL